jgi:hypothetical protein
MEKYTLKILDLETETDKKVYNGYLEQIDDLNPFYKLELLGNPNVDQNNLKYFIFLVRGTPAVLMNFFVRKIDIDLPDGPFYDIISPYGYSGPLFKKQIESETIINFWELVDHWYLTHNMVSEFIRFSLNGNHIKYTGKLIETLLNVKGEIKDSFEKQWTSFSSKVRNNYRKAEKYNLKFKIYQGTEITDDIIKEFHEIYISTMGRNSAKEFFFFEIEYFQSIIYANPKHFAIALDYKDGTAASTELIVISNETIYAYLGGTRSEYFEFRPNDFLRVEILKWAVYSHKKYYVLGGGQQDNDGIYRSKKGFFPKDLDAIFYTGRKIINEELYNNLTNTLLKKENSINSDFFPAYRINT